MRKALLILGIIVLAAIVWLYIGVSRVISAENDVRARFRDIVQYYVSMDQDYVTPLVRAQSLGSADMQSLQDISSKMRALGQVVDVDEQYEKLILLQKVVISFIGSGSYTEEFMADPRLSQWSKNATNYGIASMKVRAYNEALSAYNARFQSTAGKLAGLWKRWSHHQYLGIDGSEEDEVFVTF